MDPSQIRNFSIIAHIDHGKSTLADRILLRCGAITQREFHDQFLDDMDLEREMGITIKANRCTLDYEHGGVHHMLNLLDTPGHVDFHYEVSRALAACEGVVLLVDAAQGVQAQTVANAHLAVEAGLAIIPVVNKIDLPAARPEDTALELEHVLGIDSNEVVFVSAKTGEGVEELLGRIVEKVPPPVADAGKPLRALIYDAKPDPHRGVICHLRVFDGQLNRGDRITLMAAGREYHATEIGKFCPKPRTVQRLWAGEVGYLVGSIKTIRDVNIGDTITLSTAPADKALPGYQPPLQMVFCDFYPGPGTETNDLRDAIEKLWLNDSSFSFEPTSSDALGLGFRCGFLGLLHMKIVQERLERESDIDVVQTAPTVTYEVLMTDGTVRQVSSPSALPERTSIQEIREPFIRAELIVPAGAIGAVMQLAEERRGIYKHTEYLSPTRVMLGYEFPLGEVLYDFYDRLKGLSQGYGTMDYELIAFRPGELVKLDILVNAEPVDALSTIVHRSKAEARGRRIIAKLRTTISRHLFNVPLQAAVGGKILARETIPAVRKNVLAKCYGGDVTRKRKLLEKQKAGKRRMKTVGSVEIPQEAFLSVLETGE